jgi:hypothetical protein
MVSFVQYPVGAQHARVSIAAEAVTGRPGAAGGTAAFSVIPGAWPAGSFQPEAEIHRGLFLDTGIESLR